ncbi:hypothetical protein [Secundilactobacillus kimchicus]|uniref:Uncharacterized protein n=1 Tax=Secundilactobacillus kimchicus JCM 15530 TaxID=1302272 RepID=A0A0R1HLB1_9LACO|nr:hypothetical protein [Secundilactobacillus kimchicus]KRK47509.1 hypothetical protein FC96_GL002435 [Secundilactobacillus kimchicus JCM 15530]
MTVQASIEEAMKYGELLKVQLELPDQLPVTYYGYATGCRDDQLTLATTTHGELRLPLSRVVRAGSVFNEVSDYE